MFGRFDQTPQQISDRSTAISILIETARKNRATKLDLSDKNLTQLPESINQLVWLRYLDLSANQLAALPEFISNLAQLKYLNLSSNLLQTLPQSMGQLSQLQYLDLSKNIFKELPESISQLIQLRTLSLFRNLLQTLPQSMSQLTRLQQLNVEYNPLKTVPEVITQLTQLQILNLTRNELTDLPGSLRNMKSLRGLYIHGNPDLNLPFEILGPKWQDGIQGQEVTGKPNEILEYYFRLQGGQRPLNEAKLILVGRGGVGKTSIVNRLVNDRFEPDEKKTEGIRISKWKLHLDEKDDVRLNIWDFGGQEIMHATHQFFLTQRSLYLLVLNGREGGEDADAEYWLKLIESLGNESPVIVVLNKIKEHPFDLNRRALQQKYPAIRAFIKTDCEDRTGIDQLYQAIESETYHLEHLRDSFPESWFSIKDKLSEMKKNYLSFDEYREFCKQHGENDKAAQQSLIGYLHNLGIVLNFKDDPRLRDTNVLNPHWVTNGIYKILNSNKLEKQKGEIRLTELSEILSPNEYPPGMCRFIFDLMKKFELCLSFPDDDSHYLIPELLDKQEPAEAAEFRPRECLNFQYYYPVLPEGLLPRFIVRTHVLSEEPARWRTGVIIEFEDCRALIKADMQDKRVLISVSGPMVGRRRLLAIIRSDFERIHHDIRNLQPQEMIPLPEYLGAAVPYKDFLLWESEGRQVYSLNASGKIRDLLVSELLNEVDFEAARKGERVGDALRHTVRLFYCYSHKDERLRNELETHLKILHRQRLIEAWHDRNIEAGDDWKRIIDENLEQADIILLLVSASFIASDYCYEKEMKRALERHEKGDVRLIPVIVRDVNWRNAPFAKLQALPKDGLAVTKWPKKDSAWRNVSEGIERVVEQIQKRGSENK